MQWKTCSAHAQVLIAASQMPDLEDSTHKAPSCKAFPAFPHGQVRKAHAFSA